MSFWYEINMQYKEPNVKNKNNTFKEQLQNNEKG